jgi:hypothetical protein
MIAMGRQTKHKAGWSVVFVYVRFGFKSGHEDMT